jgi:hypothetical protein
MDRIDRIDRIAEWLRPDEIQPALNLVELLEKSGQMSADDANEWRRRIEAWARYHAVAAETEPSG